MCSSDLSAQKPSAGLEWGILPCRLALCLAGLSQEPASAAAQQVLHAPELWHASLPPMPGLLQGWPAPSPRPLGCRAQALCLPLCSSLCPSWLVPFGKIKRNAGHFAGHHVGRACLSAEMPLFHLARGKGCITCSSEVPHASTAVLLMRGPLNELV